MIHPSRQAYVEDTEMGVDLANIREAHKLNATPISY